MLLPALHQKIMATFWRDSPICYMLVLVLLTINNILIGFFVKIDFLATCIELCFFI